MAVVGEDRELGQRIRELDKEYVLHSWSVQNQINPLPVAGAEGCWFWDYDGNRYLDFASPASCRTGRCGPAERSRR